MGKAQKLLKERHKVLRRLVSSRTTNREEESVRMSRSRSKASSQEITNSGSQTSFCRIPRMGAAPKSFTQFRLEGAHICKEMGVTFTSCTL